MKCLVCQSSLIYDDWEDCFLCSQCGEVVYPCDLGLKDNPDAGIWKLGKDERAADKG